MHPCGIAKAPVLDPDHLGTVEPDRHIELREMQHLGLSPDGLDIVFAGTLGPARPIAAGPLFHCESSAHAQYAPIAI